MCLPAASEEEGTQRIEERKSLARATTHRRQRIWKSNESDQSQPAIWQLGMASAKWKPAGSSLCESNGSSISRHGIRTSDKCTARSDVLPASIDADANVSTTANITPASVRTRASAMVQATRVNSFEQ